MFFLPHYDDEGVMRAIDVRGDFDAAVSFSKSLLEMANARFFRHGDGLVSIVTRQGTATYGITGDGTVGTEPVFYAVLLNVNGAHDA